MIDNYCCCGHDLCTNLRKTHHLRQKVVRVPRDLNGKEKEKWLQHLNLTEFYSSEPKVWLGHFFACDISKDEVGVLKVDKASNKNNFDARSDPCRLMRPIPIILCFIKVLHLN
jgi:hypothetical protein